MKYDLDRSTMHPQVRPDWGLNSWPLNHDSTFHVTETPTLTTQPAVTSIIASVATIDTTTDSITTDTCHSAPGIDTCHLVWTLVTQLLVLTLVTWYWHLSPGIWHLSPGIGHLSPGIDTYHSAPGIVTTDGNVKVITFATLKDEAKLKGQLYLSNIVNEQVHFTLLQIKHVPLYIFLNDHMHHFTWCTPLEISQKATIDHKVHSNGSPAGGTWMDDVLNALIIQRNRPDRHDTNWRY